MAVALTLSYRSFIDPFAVINSIELYQGPNCLSTSIPWAKRFVLLWHSCNSEISGLTYTQIEKMGMQTNISPNTRNLMFFKTFVYKPMALLQQKSDSFVAQ